MKTILLLGELGKKFGRKHKLAVKSPAEAIRALVANFAEFERHLVESGERGIAYRVIIGKSDISKLDDIHNPASDRESIKIVPVIQGAKSVLSTIATVVVGVALVAAAFFLPVVPLLGMAFLPSAAGLAFGLGTALILGGVSQMLSSTPTNNPQSLALDGATSSSASSVGQNNPSYSFDGAVNVSAQGVPVPVGYGRLIVGSAVISAGISTENI